MITFSEFFWSMKISLTFCQLFFSPTYIPNAFVFLSLRLLATDLLIKFSWLFTFRLFMLHYKKVKKKPAVNIINFRPDRPDVNLSNDLFSSNYTFIIIRKFKAITRFSDSEIIISRRNFHKLELLLPLSFFLVGVFMRIGEFMVWFIKGKVMWK